MKIPRLSSAAFAALCLAFSVRGASPALLVSAFYDWDALPAVPSHTGSVRQVINAPTRTLRLLSLHISTLNPGPRVPPHHHPEESLTLVKEGSVRYWSNGKIFDAGPGALVFPSADALHTPYNVSAQPTVYYAISFATETTPRVPGSPADEWAAPGQLHTTVFRSQGLPRQPTRSGTRCEVVSAATPTLVRLESTIETLNPGADTGILADPADELIFVQAGLVDITLQGVAGRLGPGSFCFKASGDTHSVKNMGSAPAVFQVIRFVTAQTPHA